MRTTLADVRASRIPASLGLCPTDERVAAFVNEAQQRLITEGSWWGLVARFRCQAVEGALVWPRQIATILGASVSQVPIKVRDEFFEFVELGMGIQDSENADMVLLDRGTSPVFSAIDGTDKQIKVYCDLASDAGTPVLLLGYDDNANWIRTDQSGIILDGEVVLASVAGTLSVSKFSAITGVQKLETNGPVRLYEYDSVSLTQRAIAKYEYDETNPQYRVSYIPTLDTEASATCPQTVEIIGKLEFLPVKRDTDYLLIGCIPALKDMCQAIKAAELEPLQENRAKAITAGLALAKMSLEAEARHYRGAPQSNISITGFTGVTGEPTPNIL